MAVMYRRPDLVGVIRGSRVKSDGRSTPARATGKTPDELRSELYAFFARIGSDHAKRVKK